MGMSNPHFLYADPWLSEQIIGLDPDEQKHKNYFLLEPVGSICTQIEQYRLNMIVTLV